MSLDQGKSNCSPNYYRSRIYKRKLSVLSFIKDSLERRISAVDAAIDTLNKQIDREDNN